MNTILGKKYCVFPHRGRMPICVKCQISFYFNDRSKSANWYLCSHCQDFTSSLQGKAVPCRRWSGKAKSLSGFLWKQSSFPIGMAGSYFLSYSDVLKTCATWNGISPHVNLCIPQFLFHFPWSHQRPHQAAADLCHHCESCSCSQVAAVRNLFCSRGRQSGRMGSATGSYTTGMCRAGSQRTKLFRVSWWRSCKMFKDLVDCKGHCSMCVGHRLFISATSEKNLGS